jgi:hypothetical protein
MGALEYNNPLNMTLFEKLRARPELRDRIVRVQARELSPFAAFSTGEVARWMAGALLRGRFGVVKPFLAAGKRGQEVASELAMRKRLADEAQALTRNGLSLQG